MLLRSHVTICSRYSRSVRWLIVLSLVACSSKKEPPAPTPADKRAVTHDASSAALVGSRIEPVADHRVELLAIAMRISGAPEYQNAKGRYAQAVDAWFAPHAKHPAIVMTRELRAKHGIAYDAPITFAVHLDNKLALSNAAEIPTIDARWQGVDLEAYAAALRALATDAKLSEFYTAHASDIDLGPLREVAAVNPIPFYEDVFQKRAAHIVVGSPLLEANNVGVRNGDTFYQVMSTPTVPLLVHEMAHSYVNPMIARHAARFEIAGTTIYPLVMETMRAQRYGSWKTMIDESCVRALVVLFMRETKGDVAGAAQARDETRAGFLWINELTEVFRRYKRGTERDEAALVAQLATFFDNLAKQYAATGVPKTPFLGPFDAVLRRPYVVALPAGVLGDYARKLPFFANKPFVDPASKIATGTGIVAYGSPASNDVVAAAAQLGAWKISDEGIELGAKKFAGKHLVLIATWFRGDDPTNGMAIYAAANDRDLVGINSLRHGQNDWLVARREGTRYTVIEAGDWPVDANAWVPFK